MIGLGVGLMSSDSKKPRKNIHKKYGNKKTFWKGSAPMGYVN